MKKTYCDNCGEELPENTDGYTYGFDSCESEICQAKLTIRAVRENWTKPFIALQPSQAQVDEARKILGIKKPIEALCTGGYKP